jgi:hypothetical protein
MFSFQRDKAGFFFTLLLLFITLGAAVTTIVLITVGAAQGNWKEYLLSWKWVVGSCWVACIVTVLLRVSVFRWQVLRAERRAAEEEAARERKQEPSAKS